MLLKIQDLNVQIIFWWSNIFKCSKFEHLQHLSFKRSQECYILIKCIIFSVRFKFLSSCFCLLTKFQKLDFYFAIFSNIAHVLKYNFQILIKKNRKRKISLCSKIFAFGLIECQDYNGRMHNKRPIKLLVKCLVLIDM